MSHGVACKLIPLEVPLSGERGYGRLAVIAAVGTRGYYRKRGFADGALYQVREIG